MAAGALLTGGRSTRLGPTIDKARLRYRGSTLAARAAEVLRAVCDPVVEVGPGRTDLARVQEEPPGAGPLAALGAAVAHLGDARPIIVLACDLPAIGVATLRRFTAGGDETIVGRAEDRLQPVCARYGPAALARVPILLASGARSLHALLDQVAYTTVELTADEARDVDTAADAAAFGIELPR